MTRRQLPTMPSTSFALLLVEGGDERGVCQAIVDPAVWTGICCWPANGRNDLPNLARLATLDPNFGHARAIGLLMDVEDNLGAAQALAARTLTVFGGTAMPSHGMFVGASPKLGLFLAPDGTGAGAIETLCRQSARNPALSACVDQLVACAGGPHNRSSNVRANEDKGWLKAYLGMLPDPNLRFHQAFTMGLDPAHAVFDPLRAFLQAL